MIGLGWSVLDIAIRNRASSGGAAISAPSALWTDYSEFVDTAMSGGGTIVTASSQDIGLISATRRVVVFLQSNAPNSQTIVSASLAPLNADASSAGSAVALTVHKASVGSASAGNYVMSGVVPTGVLAHIVVTLSGTVFVTPYVSVFAVDNALIEGSPTIAEGSVAAGTSMNATVTGAATGGLILASAVWSASIFRTHTFSGAAVEQDVPDRGIGRVQYQASGNKTITSTWAGDTDGYLTLVYWPPKAGAVINAPAVLNLPDFIIGIGGQSNMDGMLNANAGLEARVWSGTRYWNGSAWVYWPAGSFPSGDGVRALLNNTRLYRNGTVGVISIGMQSGTSISFMRKGQTLYDNALIEVGQSGGYLDALCRGAHEADYNMASGTYYAHVDSLHGEWATDVGMTKATLPMYVSGLGPETDAGIDNTEWAAAQAMNQAVADSTDAQFSHTMMDAVLSDTIHWTAASQQKHGRRFAQTVAGVPELVSNGEFASDTAWTKGTGWSIASGIATKTAGTGATLAQTFPITAGASYEVIFTVTAVTAGTIVARLTGGTTVSGASRNAVGTYAETLVAVTGNNQFSFLANSAFAGSIDNVSVKML